MQYRRKGTLHRNRMRLDASSLDSDDNTDSTSAEVGKIASDSDDVVAAPADFDRAGTRTPTVPDNDRTGKAGNSSTYTAGFSFFWARCTSSADDATSSSSSSSSPSLSLTLSASASGERLSSVLEVAAKAGKKNARHKQHVGTTQQLNRWDAPWKLLNLFVDAW